MLQQVVSQSLPLLVQVIVLVVGVLGSVALHKAQGYLGKLKQSSQTSLISELAFNVVNLAEAQLKDGMGADKFDFALNKLSEILASKKIDVSESELHAAIETAVTHLPKEFHSFLTPVLEQPSTTPVANVVKPLQDVVAQPAPTPAQPEATTSESPSEVKN